MIQLKKLNNAPIVVNADHIEFIEETPDTVITLMNNDKVVVLDSLAEVVEKVVRFRRQIAGLIKEETERQLHEV